MKQWYALYILLCYMGLWPWPCTLRPTVVKKVSQEDERWLTRNERGVNRYTGAGNYQQPQLPTANMAGADIGTERYSPFMQILRTHSGILNLYTTE